MKIALVQFARSKEEKQENIERMIDLLEGINDVDLVCLPENWFGVEPLSEEEFEDLISEFKKLAVDKGYNLLTGAGYMWKGENVFDSGYVIDTKGRVLGHSDKMFPSESVGETGFLSDGEELPVFEVDKLKFGVVVCVDAVYPEVSRSLADKGVKVIFNPSNIPENRLGMWKSIGITRAVENGAFFIFINNTSTYYPDGRKVSGHSFVASPNGEIVSELDEDEQVFEFEIDLGKIDEVRSRWGFLERVNKRDFFDSSYESES